jgi:hypothetical protein
MPTHFKSVAYIRIACGGGGSKTGGGFTLLAHHFIFLGENEHITNV